MPISSVSANAPVKRAQLNALAEELDAILRGVFQGKSPFVYDYAGRGDSPDDVYLRTMFGNRFFFGASGLWKLIPAVFGAVSEYDHNTYLTAANAMTLASFDEDKHLAICSDASWPLDDSLGVHTIEKNGVDYYLAREGGDDTRPIAERERFLRLPVAEIICESITELEWDARFTRYHFLRFHNLSTSELTVTLPGADPFVIPALGCQAVRRTYPAVESWEMELTYLWKWRRGDSAQWSGDLANNVGGLQCLHDWIDWLCQTNAVYGYVLRDPAVVADAPDVSPFPEIDTEKRLVEYDKHAGRILAWKIEAGVAAEAFDYEPTFAELENGTGPLKVSIDTGTHTITVTPTEISDSYDAMGPGSTILPRYPMELPATVASGAYPGSDCSSAYVPLTLPSYDAQYRTSRADAGTFITESTGDLPVYGLGLWSTVSYPEATVGDALESITNNKSPSLGDELTTLPDLALAHDGFRLWLTGTHEFPATSYLAPFGIGGIENDVKFWWTINQQIATQTFGVDLTDRDGWLHSTAVYGRHVVEFDGYIDGLGNAVQEGNPDVSGTYGLDEGLDWQESRAEHETPTIKRCEAPNETRTETWTRFVRPREDVSERAEINASDLEWYNLNRTDLNANSPTESDLAAVVMYPILRTHHNHLAARLNGIKAILPFRFEHVVYWGEIDDGTWPAAFSSNVPVAFYCSALSSGSRADELGITVQSVTESATTGYYVTASDVASKASELGLAFTYEGVHGYRTRLIPPDVTEQGLWQWTHSRTVEDYRAELLPDYSTWAVSTRTENAEGYFIPHPGTGDGFIATQEHIIDLIQHVNFPEIPDGWQEESGSRLLCSPVQSIGYVNDPLVEPRSLESVVIDGTPTDVWSTDFEAVEMVAAPTGYPKYLEIGSELTFPATHADITTAMGSTGDARSEWQIMYIRRLLIVRT